MALDLYGRGRSRFVRHGWTDGKTTPDRRRKRQAGKIGIRVGEIEGRGQIAADLAPPSTDVRLLDSSPGLKKADD